MNLNSLNFIAIDFETANKKRESACSVSLVTYKKGAIIDTYTTYINPEDTFEPFNIYIHGITPDMVKEAPTFPQVMETIRPLLESHLVLAHNASFDISVIRKSCERYRIPLPSITYFCTRYLSAHLHENLVKHDLATICKALQIPLLHHHEAEADAIACGNILVQCMENENITSLEELQEQHFVHYKTISQQFPYDQIPYISKRKSSS